MRHAALCMRTGAGQQVESRTTSMMRRAQWQAVGGPAHRQAAESMANREVWKSVRAMKAATWPASWGNTPPAVRERRSTSAGGGRYCMTSSAACRAPDQAQGPGQAPPRARG